MSTHFEEELSQLKQRLLTMASLAENAVRSSVQALLTRDLTLALKVRDEDSVLDRFEVEIDEACLGLLAKAPLAGDLRLITVAMKICQNLERIGDEASKVAKRARDLSQEPPLAFSDEMQRMAELSLQMLKDSLDSFVRQDAVLARAIIPRDKQVDEMHKTLQRALVGRMREDSEAVMRCVHLMTAIKSLERIADHATNIAEEVVFLCEAEDIRHTHKLPRVPSS